MPTRRELLKIHLRDGEATARDLAKLLGLKVRLVLDDLEHLRLSNRRSFELRPARCTGCGYVFKKRERLSTPSRCPKCRSERIIGPWMSLTE